MADSTCIIYLAKVGKLDLPKAVYGKVLVPGGVYDETVRQGKEKGFIDAEIIEKAVKEGLIGVRELSKAQKREAKHLRSLAAIGKGEAEAIILAKDSKSDLVMDDAVALGVARLHGLDTLWTTTLILKAVHRGLITKREGREIIEELVAAGYRLAEDVLVELLRVLGR
ncbi:MAG: DUF3368 domain-containing protein [Candidatus Hadarchaeota archaeon]|nr:DUF3368 domain-containing protein [Candidatus Hadarchaeota archaeon]